MDLQTVLALSIVGVCGGYVAWKYVSMLLNPAKGACHCADCPVATSEPCREPACASTDSPSTTGIHREIEV